LFVIKIVIIFVMEGKLLNLVKENEEKLSLEFCKKILNVNGNDYSDDEVLRIRDYLYQLAEIECRHFKDWQEQQHNKIIAVNCNDYETTESHPIHQSEYRRAS
jgi:hypothetical protein